MSRPCNDCHATIKWVTLIPSGKPIAVDPQPLPDRGTVAASRDPSTGRLVGHVIARDRPLQAHQQRYVVHKASCHPERDRVARPPGLFDDDPKLTDAV